MASIEACWTVRYGDPSASEGEQNGGVIVLESGRVYGGDSGFAILGSYAVDANGITGSLRIVRHDPEWVSMYDRDEDAFDASFAAALIDDDTIRGAVLRPNYPQAALTLRRLAELP